MEPEQMTKADMVKAITNYLQENTDEDQISDDEAELLAKGIYELIFGE